jgi:hypothetical protein
MKLKDTSTAKQHWQKVLELEPSNEKAKKAIESFK